MSVDSSTTKTSGAPSPRFARVRVMTKSATLYPDWYIGHMTNQHTLQDIITITKRAQHDVTFTTNAHRRNTLSADYRYAWTLRAECKECGWSNYTVRNCEGFSNESNITEADKQDMLQKHFNGVGIYAVTEGEHKGCIYVREADGTGAFMRHGSNGWETI